MQPGQPLKGLALGWPGSPEDLFVDADGGPVRIDKAFSWEYPLSVHGLMHNVITNAWRDWAARQLGRAYRKESGVTPDQLTLWRPIVALAWLRARPPVRNAAFTRYLDDALRGAGLPVFS